MSGSTLLFPLQLGVLTDEGVRQLNDDVFRLWESSNHTWKSAHAEVCDLWVDSALEVLELGTDGESG